MSPTFERGDSFLADWSRLTPADRDRFRVGVTHLVEDLSAQRSPRAGLRVKRVQGTRNVWEMTWAPNGRATFTYGPQVLAGHRHVQWRRIGTHDILDRP